MASDVTELPTAPMVAAVGSTPTPPEKLPVPTPSTDTIPMQEPTAMVVPESSPMSPDTTHQISEENNRIFVVERIVDRRMRKVCVH